MEAVMTVHHSVQHSLVVEAVMTVHQSHSPAGYGGCYDGSPFSPTFLLAVEAVTTSPTFLVVVATVVMVSPFQR